MQADRHSRVSLRQALWGRRGLWLGVGLVVLQYALWFGRDGLVDGFRLDQRLTRDQAVERLRSDRDQSLAVEVNDLKYHGRAAVEEEARSELGMIRRGETFYQVVPSAPSTEAFIPYPDGSGIAYGSARHSSRGPSGP